MLGVLLSPSSGYSIHNMLSVVLVTPLVRSPLLCSGWSDVIKISIIKIKKLYSSLIDRKYRLLIFYTTNSYYVEAVIGAVSYDMEILGLVI